MNKRLKGKFVVLCMIIVSTLGGCGAAGTTGATGANTTEEDVEHLEQYDNLSDEETTQKMVQEADTQEVVPDDKQ